MFPNMGTERRRVAALVFLLVIVSCASIALIAIVGLSAQMNSSIARSEQQARADLAMQGAVANIRSQMNAGSLSVPNTQTITIDNFPCVTTTTDNGASVPNSYQIAISASRWNRTYTLTRITGLPYSAANSLYKYALALNSACTMSSTLKTHDVSVKGSVYSHGAINFGVNGSIIQGDADFTTPSTNHVVTVNGTRTTNYTPRTWPTLSDTPYDNAANYTFGNHSVGNINPGGGPTLVVINGDMTFNGGTVTGEVTYYVTGNVTVSNDITYANGSSLLAVICKGTTTFAANANAVGIYFTSGIVWGSGCTITNGLLCLNNATTFSQALDITYDNSIRDGGTLGKSMYLPGLWP